MSDWTPTTEQVRDGYRYDPADDYYNPVQAGANAERNGRAFDRWLAQTLREAKAEALQDAADKLDGGYHPTPTRFLDWHGEVGFYGEADWLRALANELLKGQDR